MMRAKVDMSGLEKFIKHSPERARWSFAESLKMTGGHVRKQIRAFVEKGGENWPALSEKTRAQRGDGKTPLHFMAKMIRFKYRKFRGDQQVLIGFFPTKKRIKADRQATGQTYQMVGTKAARKRFRESFGVTYEKFLQIHEYGLSFPVKRTVRGAFAYRGDPLKGATKRLDVPKRPIVTPVFMRIKDTIGKYVEMRFKQKFFGNDPKAPRA